MLLSIVIPTKNRYSTLFVVVQTILENITSDDYEIVIQDNSDDNTVVHQFLSEMDNKKIAYYYHKKSIPISDNTELAIENAKGKYILFIGDDDFVSPYVLNVVHKMEHENINCLTYSAGNYWWDSIKFSEENFYQQSQILWMPKNINTQFIKQDAKLGLKKMLNKGAIDYYGLPRCYHGIVRKTILRQLKLKIGRYIVGSCPDIDFAVSLSLLLDEFYYVNFPVTLFGASKNSGGGWTATKKHYGKLEGKPLLRSNIVDVWDKNIPKVWSEKTIYPETTSEVLRAYKSDYKINYIPFYAAMLIHEPYVYPKPYKQLLNYCGINPIKHIRFVYQIVRKIIGLKVKQIKIKHRQLNIDVFHKINTKKLLEIMLKQYRFEE